MEGVNIQGVHGPFSDEPSAFTFALDSARSDRDAYHDWCVRRLTMNGLGDRLFETDKDKAQP
jgi:hypothetical protein